MSLISTEGLEKQLGYWKKQLSGIEPLALPTDKARPKEIVHSMDNVFFAINKGLSTQLSALSKAERCTLYVTLLSGFYILLSKYTAQEDIVVGTPAADKNNKEVESLVSFFANSLALKEHVDREQTVKDLMSRISDNLIEAQRHQDLPFEKLVEELDIETDNSRHPIFQVMFGLQSFGRDSESTLLKFAAINNASMAQFDLSCVLDDGNEEINGMLNFATSLYEKETIERMAKHYLLVLEQMVNDEDKAIKNYNLLTPPEYNQIVIDWNQTGRDYPKDKTIHQLFEEQVEKTPDSIALVFENEELTYNKLNQQANQLARYIQSQTTIKPDDLIGLCLDRSIEMIVGILGILKAGGAYAPIDPGYPEERIKYIIEDTNAKLVLTQSHLIKKLNDITKANLIVLDKKEYQKEKTSSLRFQSKATDLTYVIYTSGTTGKPKGVMIEHRSISNLISNQILSFKIKQENVVLFANYIFDASIEQIFISLLSGSSLYIPHSDTIRDTSLFEQFLLKNEITHLHATPSYLDGLGFKHPDIKLKRIVAGGEVFNPKLIPKYNGTVINEYGPTETSVTSSQLFVKNQEFIWF